MSNNIDSLNTLDDVVKRAMYLAKRPLSERRRYVLLAIDAYTWLNLHKAERGGK